MTVERIENLFKDKKAHIAYFTAGDGGITHSLEVAKALIAGGATLLEIGIPFSDPVADGPVIQRAAARALAQCVTLNDILWLIAEIRKFAETPLILFTYYNPIFKILHTSFLNDARNSGLDGLLIVDCPIEENEEIRTRCRALDLAFVGVITANTPIERIKIINQHASGFLYYACRPGPTGIKSSLPNDFTATLQRIKSNVSLPVVVGFGISTASMVKEVLALADGVVIGSLFVKALEDNEGIRGITQLATALFSEANDFKDVSNI